GSPSPRLPPPRTWPRAAPPALSDARHLGHLVQLTVDDHTVDDAVFAGLVGAHDEVAVGVLGDLLDRLAGVVGQHRVQEVPHPEDLLGRDLDVGRLARSLAVWLVDEDP